jgi:hypothetical protein
VYAPGVRSTPHHVSAASKVPPHALLRNRKPNTFLLIYCCHTDASNPKKWPWSTDKRILKHQLRMRIICAPVQSENLRATSFAGQFRVEPYRIETVSQYSGIKPQGQPCSIQQRPAQSIVYPFRWQAKSDPPCHLDHVYTSVVRSLPADAPAGGEEAHI